MLNLAINARNAMPIGGTLCVTTSNVRLGEPLFPEEPAAGEYVSICVSDTGCGMSGAELARHVRHHRPDLPVLFVTGFAERTALSGISDRQIVSKPFVTGKVAKKVQLALAAGVLNSNRKRFQVLGRNAPA